MVAYRMRETDESYRPDPKRTQRRRPRLAHDLFHGLTPEEFDSEAKSLAEAESMTPAVRARLRAQLTERLLTSPDTPSWGPDWVRHGDRFAPKYGKERLAYRGRQETDDEENDKGPLSSVDEDTARLISRNLEKSRQLHHYRGLYIVAAVIAIAIAVLAMFVDYQIIRGDIWTRALSNEFMVVPDSLQATVIFKSLQVIFAVLIVHFMLKITGVYGRNALITTAFVLALVMIGCLGYLVAYNNMPGGTQAQAQASRSEEPATQNNSIDQLFNSLGDARPSQASLRTEPVTSHEAASIPKVSPVTLANADSWFWLAFASVIFFIVTTVAALYMQTTENNIRNAVISNDYRHRQRQFAQLHLLDLADREQGV